jgi:hypothetical protein
MALFMIERTFAEVLDADIDEEDDAVTEALNGELGLEWVHTFLTADRTRTYCLYESPNAELLQEHARRLGIPADAIVEVTQYR